MANEIAATNTLIGESKAHAGTVAPRRPEGHGPEESSELDRARPRLRHDVVFAESSEGVFLRHADDGFVLKGKSAYRWVAALSPHLTGEHTVAELCQGLRADQRRTVAALVHTLLERGFARDYQPSGAHDLAETVTKRFASQLAFIEHYVDAAHTRFARFRDSTVVVVGAGETARAAALGLLRNGLRVVDLHGASAELHEELAACARELTDRGAPADVRVQDDLTGYDVVVASVEDIGVAGLSRLVRQVRGDTVLLPVTTVAGEAVLGPATRAGAYPCWTCAMLRLTGNLPADVMSPLWQDIAIDGQSAATGPLHPIAARMIGNALAFDVFRLRTGCLPAESESAVVVVDTETLTSTREALVVHPECPSCRPLAIAQAAGSAPSTASAPSPSDRELSERYWRLVDPHVGLFAAYTDESLPQSPVKAARVRIGLGTAPREITAFDVRNLLAARNRAVQTAALRYADRLGRGQPTQVATSKQQSAHGSVARPDRLGTWSGIPVPEDQRLHWLTATSALSGDRWYVPAAAVYDLFDDGKLFDSPSAGAGGGVDLTAAVEAGVLSALGYRALRATAAGATVSDATADYPEDPEITMLLHAAEHLGHPIRVYALPADDCAVSVLATTTDSDESPPRWVVSTAWTARDAVCDAARDLVGVLQLASDGPVDLGGRIAPDFDPRTVRVGTGHRVGPRDGRALWRRHLAEAGLDALVVETTPPDLVCADTALQTVRVLLHQIATGEGGALT